MILFRGPSAPRGSVPGIPKGENAGPSRREGSAQRFSRKTDKDGGEDDVLGR